MTSAARGLDVHTEKAGGGGASLGTCVQRRAAAGFGAAQRRVSALLWETSPPPLHGVCQWPAHHLAEGESWCGLHNILVTGGCEECRVMMTEGVVHSGCPVALHSQ